MDFLVLWILVGFHQQEIGDMKVEGKGSEYLFPGPSVHLNRESLALLKWPTVCHSVSFYVLITVPFPLPLG